MESVVKQDDDVPSPSQTIDLKHLISELKTMVEDKQVSADVLTSYLNIVEEHMDERPPQLTDAEKQEIVDLIERHPYFKNPCDYHIRLITLMKYLKRKGVDTKRKDIDLIVDQLIADLPAVVKVEFGRYYKEKR